MPYNPVLTAAQCRDNAKQCTDIANALEPSPRKTLMLVMARSWVALANQVDRFEGLPTE